MSHAILMIMVAAAAVSGLACMKAIPAAWFGAPGIRKRLHRPHLLTFVSACIGCAVFAVLPSIGLTAPFESQTPDQEFLLLSIVLVYFMLFGFIAFEAGA